MKVRICSGNQKGVVVDMPQTEAENALSTGYAELYDEKDQAALDLKNASVAKGAATKAPKTEQASKRKATKRGK